MAHVQTGDVTHVRQCQEELKSLLTVTSDLQRYSDGLTFSLLHLSEFSQYAGGFIGTFADREPHARPYQRRQRPIIKASVLERSERLA